MRWLILPLLLALTAPAWSISTVSRYKTWGREILTSADMNALQDHLNNKINELVAIHPGDSTKTNVVRTDTLRSKDQVRILFEDPLIAEAPADSFGAENGRIDTLASDTLTVTATNGQRGRIDTLATDSLTILAGGQIVAPRITADTLSVDTLTIIPGSKAYIARAIIDSIATDSLTVIGPTTISGATATGALTVTGAILPNADDGGALGASGTGWSDLFLASGGVINWNAGDVTLTHAADKLTVAGGKLHVADATNAGAGPVGSVQLLGGMYSAGRNVSKSGYGIDLAAGGATPYYYFDDFSGNFFIGKSGSDVRLQSQGEIHIYAGNGEAIVINTSQRVGIGTATPGVVLDVKAANANDAMRLLDNDSANQRANLRLNSGTGQIDLYNDSNTQTVQVASATSSYFNGGNVGIGEASPAAKLDVYDNTATANPVLKLTQDNPSATGTLIYGNNDGTGKEIDLHSQSNSGDPFQVYYEQQGSIADSTWVPIYIVGSSTESGTISLTNQREVVLFGFTYSGYGTYRSLDVLSHAKPATSNLEYQFTTSCANCDTIKVRHVNGDAGATLTYSYRVQRMQ